MNLICIKAALHKYWSVQIKKREELKLLLKEYKEVFPTELPKTVPPNHRLGNEMHISL